MIGARTLTSLTLFVATAAVGVWFDLLNPSYLSGVDPEVLFWTALFAMLAGTLVFSFLGMVNRSAYYFRVALDGHLWEDESPFVGLRSVQVAVGKNPGDAFDLPPSLQHGVFVFLFFVLGVGTFDLRTLDLMVEFPARVAATGNRFCPDPEETQVVEEKVDPGCALVRRAYDLGFAKDLGSCAPEEEERGDVCLLRQRDEPLLHYAWRLLDESYTDARRGLAGERWASMRTSFEAKAPYLEPLYRVQRDVVDGAPRASHHLWTNLPQPYSWWQRLTQGFFNDSTRCESYRRLPPRPEVQENPERQASREVNHVLGQLLFDPRYADTAGSCREYHVHWGAPNDICERLAEDPQGVLREWGVWSDVTQVQRRYNDRIRLNRLAFELGSSQRASGWLGNATQQSQSALQRAVSFQCYVEDAGASRALAWRATTLWDKPFEIAEMRARDGAGDPERFVERYADLSKLLVKGYHYGNLSSQVSPLLALQPSSGEQVFRRSEGYLAKLEFLTDMDIYLGDPWVLRRDDLLEVYPYHIHLRNVVERFRRRYAKERGRL